MDEKFELSSPDSSLMDAMDLFFKNRSIDTTKIIFFKLFQCWGVKECDQAIGLSNEDMALFLDQLGHLVDVAHTAYQANRVTGPERKSHE